MLLSKGDIAAITMGAILCVILIAFGSYSVYLCFGRSCCQITDIEIVGASTGRAPKQYFVKAEGESLSNSPPALKPTTVEERNFYETVVAEPSQKEQISSQFDSFSRTMMLQNVVQLSSGREEYAIREVEDPFSKNTISIGGIVVVVNPYHGTSESEFKSLQTGDLLRVVKFYVKKDSNISPRVTLHTKKADQSQSSMPSPRSDSHGRTRLPINCDDESLTDNESESASKYAQDVSITKSDANYKDIFCTGIILNSFLNFENSNITLQVKEKDGLTTNESEILKDFPLRVISLETTLLKQL